MEDGFTASAASGFDPGIFARTIPEDCVKYSIVIIDESVTTEFTLRERLTAIRDAGKKLTRDLLKDYIWQRDPFDLTLKRATLARKSDEKAIADGQTGQLALSWTLEGTTNFGDSIADEWLVVYLLLELTKQFPEAWARVADTDGEFLLIEAANALPKWLNPEIADNRVWLNGGKIKIISLSNSKNTNRIQSSNLDLRKAVELLKTDQSALAYSQSIQDEAFFRLRSHPSAIKDNLHNAFVSIPRRLAYILAQDPAYTSPAVEAFYLRDPISLKPLDTKDTATLAFPPEDFITTTVRFNKVSYAQLRSQDFSAPPAWTSVIPHLDDAQVSTGMKLTCGMEMLLADRSHGDRRAVREIKLHLEDVEAGDAMLPTDAEVDSWSKVQDDEAWLNIDYADLERELDGTKRATGAGTTKNASGKPDTSGQSTYTKANGFGDQAAQENLRKMVSRFEDFLADESAGPDGILDDMDNDDDDEDSDADESDTDSSGEDKSQSFNDAEFETAMREMMGMPPETIKESGLLDEARKLALEMEDDDNKDSAASSDDEDGDVDEIMRLMERELKSRGALRNANPPAVDIKDLQRRAQSSTQRGFIAGKRGPKRIDEVEEDEAREEEETQARRRGKAAADDDSDEYEDLGELSSDDDMEENEVDVELVRNMLEAFKTQGGLAGPAGNMLRSMGIQLPRDEADGKASTSGAKRT